MKKLYYPNAKMFVFNSFMLLAFVASSLANAQVSLLSETLVTDEALYFDGTKNTSSTNKDVNAGYDYAYGRPINPHGDCIKTYKDYVFMTWYRGGKEDRHVMLTRYNIATGAKKTIQFPHQHSGFDGKWWIGETHNTIAIGVCPINGTIHLAYDMHAYGNAGAFTNDYLRYSYSVSNLADMADDEFTLDKFVKDPLDGDYKHCTMNGVRNVGNFSRLSYPKFFLNAKGELFLCMRRGTSHDGNMVFIKYNDAASKWGSFKDVTAMGAQSKGETHDWSIYGNMKFSAGKMRLGFQRRLRNGSDKYVYQNGVYYAYCDDPTGASQWKNYKGEPMTFPLVKAGEVLIMEPGDYVQTTQKNMVHIVDGFDFEVTDRGDEHIVSKVTDKENNVKKLLHTYRKAGDSEFTTEEYNAGSELYAAGNDIYVIGLKNGRVNIVKTEGGTSNFMQIYQQSTGPTFDKGIVYISDGKLYYYLKEIAGSGAKRSTYLQVFDLDIDTTKVDESRFLSFKNMNNSTEIEPGSNLDVEARVGSAFKEVTLWSGTTSLGTLTSAPYVWSGHSILTDMNEASYTFKLIAKDSSNVEVERTVTIKIKVPSVNAFTGEGQYTFYNPIKSKWMGYDVATNDALVTATGDADINKFNVVANGEKFNIYTGDNQKVVIVNTAQGYTSMLSDPTPEVLASVDALFIITETEAGSELYYLTSGTIEPSAGKPQMLNVKGGGDDIGRGTSGAENYKWQVARIGDVVASLHENVNAMLSIYPNPTKGLIFFDGAQVQKVTIYTLSGQLMQEYNVTHNHVDVSMLSSGMYILQVEDNHGAVAVERFVVQ